MIQEFQFNFRELNIQANDLIPLLGFEDNAIPEPFPAFVEQALALAPDLCKIKCGYKVFESIEIDHKAISIKIEHAVFSPSKIVTTQLKESKSAAIFLGTAGEAISDYANQILNDDPMMAYIYDVIGSVTVEKAIDELQKKLHFELQKAGLSISDRFSPGYCEWSVAEQQLLFSLLPNKFCGISLTDSSLMSPIKSVSGIVGIGEGLRQKGYQCEWCSDKNCIYGKIKRKNKIQTEI